MKNRRELFKMLPIAALVPMVASSKEELERKLEGAKGQYLILVDPECINIDSLVYDGKNGFVDAEIWPARTGGKTPVQIFKL